MGHEAGGDAAVVTSERVAATISNINAESKIKTTADARLCQGIAPSLPMDLERYRITGRLRPFTSPTLDCQAAACSWIHNAYVVLQAKKTSPWTQDKPADSPAGLSCATQSEGQTGFF